MKNKTFYGTKTFQSPSAALNNVFSMLLICVCVQRAEGCFALINRAKDQEVTHP